MNNVIPGAGDLLAARRARAGRRSGRLCREDPAGARRPSGQTPVGAGARRYPGRACPARPCPAAIRGGSPDGSPAGAARGYPAGLPGTDCRTGLPGSLPGQTAAGPARLRLPGQARATRRPRSADRPVRCRRCGRWNRRCSTARRQPRPGLRWFRRQTAAPRRARWALARSSPGLQDGWRMKD